MALLLALLLPAALTTAAEGKITPDDPYARLQLVVKAIQFGEGHDIEDENEYSVWVDIGVCSGRIPCWYAGAKEHQHVLQYSWFPAPNDGYIIPLNRVLPFKPGPTGDRSQAVVISKEYDASDIAGFPAYDGKRYDAKILVSPTQLGQGRTSGWVMAPLAVDGELRLGVASEQARRSSDSDDKYANFTIEWEVRQMPLPDLKPTELKVLDLLGTSQKLVCATIANLGGVEAGSFETVFRVNGAPLPNGRFLAGKMGTGAIDDVCIEAILPSVAYELSVFVDEPRGLYEQNDQNNRLAKRFGSPPPTAGAAPESGPDVRVESIRVQGAKPNGTDDCDPGKNRVIVTLKNLGGKITAPFTVRVEADGITVDRSVPSLDEGKTLDVTLDDLEIKRGTRTVTATVDLPNASSESKETSPRKSVTVDCKKE